jgi:ring-1,2-phenylacetyl-CoA epoxidase subunit PaaC
MDALKHLIYRMADDALIIGHRNSEWTGLGPVLEEDIAFSSMAQDKIGIANAFYTMLHEQLGRHFLYDHAEFLRFELLQHSTYKPLANLAKKIRGELKYHILHADTWIKRLGNANEESKARMQNALNIAFPYALGLFEPTEYEDQLKQQGIFEGEQALQQQWMTAIQNIISQTELVLPEVSDVTMHYGGRKGFHTEHLQPLLNEMTEVFRLDPEAQW